MWVPVCFHHVIPPPAAASVSANSLLITVISSQPDAEDSATPLVQGNLVLNPLFFFVVVNFPHHQTATMEYSVSKF